MRDWVVLVARRALPPQPEGRGFPRNYGDIYFAKLYLVDHCKMGKCAASVGLKKKNSTKRHLDPYFDILYSMPSGDIVKDENKGLSHLRLVVGSLTTRAGREVFPISPKKAFELISGVNVAEWEDKARALILAQVVPDSKSTVAEMMAEFNQLCFRNKPSELAYGMTLSTKLEDLGFYVGSVNPSLGLSVAAYLTVARPKDLLATFPALRMHQQFIPKGMTLG